MQGDLALSVFSVEFFPTMNQRTGGVPASKAKQCAQYHQAHRTEILARNAEWKRANPARMRAIRSRFDTTRLAWMQDLKAERGCARCPERNPVCLDFHHLIDKVMSISNMRGFTLARREAEIAKCIVLCSNCHRKGHRVERAARVPRTRNQSFYDRRSEWLDGLKVANGCPCGEIDPACLDFHHRSEKHRSVSTMRGLAKERVLAEIAKCDVLCSNCHRKNTPHQTRRWEERSV